MIDAGAICRRRDGSQVLVLDTADDGGLVRVVPLTVTPVPRRSYSVSQDLHARLDRPAAVPVGELSTNGPSVTVDVMREVYRALIKLDVDRFALLATEREPFVPGSTRIPPSGKVIGTQEMLNLVDASLDGWLTTGRFNAEFEGRLADFLGVQYVATVNSGSSANLVAFSALTSPQLGERAIRPGDEIITVAAGFPTTINPALQFGAVPVFVDVEIPTYNIDASLLEEALSPRTRAVVLAHTLGNPFDLATVTRFARAHGLWLIEDCCDALGARYDGRHVGTFGDIGTLSFYPAHQITMGEGGAVFTSNAQLKVLLESFRDWGRDCYCAPGKENTCGKRFGWKLGDLPEGYDHKYIYSHLGYNLKITDMQAACGVAQLARLGDFIAARTANFDFLRARLGSCEEFLILPEPTPNSRPSWFGFPITLRDSCDFTRPQMLTYLDQHNIGTRQLFAGNLARQPYMQGRSFRFSGALRNTDIVMNRTFWIGVYPGLDETMLDYVAGKIEEFLGVGE
jgi:CDP-6-deoxy-D-xylo-4-hexulose-3-dehydrase